MLYLEIQKRIRNNKVLQERWQDYWLTPKSIVGYDYPVSRYMIHYKSKFV